jgi:hypothetical protein
MGLGDHKAGRDVMDIAECSLAELMEDPLVGLVMESDGVDRCELELIFERVVRERSGAGSRVRLPTMEAAACSPC